MVSTTRIPLGAPGLYRFPDVPIRALTGVRMDVCGFAGVAPRGPAREPVVDEQFSSEVPAVEPDRPRQRTVAVAVESFDDYKQLFGQFEGPGCLLPYAVASFFEQGGRRAYVGRIVHDYARDPAPDPARNLAGVASGTVPGAAALGNPIVLKARNEGTWGNGLTARFRFSARGLAFDPATASSTGIRVPADTLLPAGAALRLAFAAGPPQFALVASVAPQPLQTRIGTDLVVTFNQAAPATPSAVDVIDTALLLDDGDGRAEQHVGLGLSPQHPRWLATVLSYESLLVFPDASWASDPIEPEDVTLKADPPPSLPFVGGEDRYSEIVPDDFFDPNWVVGDPEPGEGVQAFALLDDLSILVAPDLYSPVPLPTPDTVDSILSVAGPEFRRCVDLPPAPPPLTLPPQDLAGLRLSPNTDLDKIINLQAALVEFADAIGSFVVLLDVPPKLSRSRILQWRNAFNSSYAVAYHPWLVVARRDDNRDAAIRIPPSATAAGIIAQVEITSGIPAGPANVIAAEVVNVDEPVPAPLHDELHPLGINVYQLERDGARLTAARTLSRDASLQQLSVRRLLLLLRRTLYEQTQWIVFEPNNSGLREQVRHLVSAYLRQLFVAGAFRGATEQESFFVRCDETNNPARIADLGQLLIEVGVAPSAPLEFIVLRIVREGDGTLNIQEVKP